MTSEHDIRLLFDDWTAALQTGDAKQVSALYEHNAILLPTVSNQVRRNHDEIEDYFVGFLKQQPKGELDQAHIRIFGECAINSGIYVFTLNDGSKIHARYTFTYHWNGQQWKIVEHHSSKMPEQ